MFLVDFNVTTGEEKLTQMVGKFKCFQFHNVFNILILKDISSIAPSTYENSELIIPLRTLPYGIFKLIFTSRMWDDRIDDPNWTRKLPFSNNVFTYIKIKKSPLKGMMIKGGVSLITRGFGQTLSLEPYMFAEDPDFPDMLVR